jgi:nucleotide-binding universal stress UspA family protein
MAQQVTSPNVVEWREPREVGEVREILFPSDLSAAADHALAHASMLAEELQAHLVLYHALVGEAEDGSESLEGEKRRREERAAYEHLLSRLDRLTTSHGVHVERAGAAAHAVVNYVRASRPDLVVMATHARRGMRRLVLGSVTEAVIDAVVAPVLCVREPDPRVVLPYRRILVPTDLSEASRRAFPLAAALARSFGAHVIALHAASPRMGRTTAGITDAIEAVVPSERTLVQFLGRAFRGVVVEPMVVLGSAWARIVEAARNERADLIVISTHGQGGLLDRVLGTHAERVVQEAPCPVVVV